MFNQGDILKNNQCERTKVLGVCGDAVFISDNDDFNIAGGGYCTHKELEADGWVVEKSEKQWKPEIEEEYYFYDTSISAVNFHYWNNDETDNSLWKTKNCFKSKQEAEEHGRKFREWVESL